MFIEDHYAELLETPVFIIQSLTDSSEIVIWTLESESKYCWEEDGGGEWPEISAPTPTSAASLAPTPTPTSAAFSAPTPSTTLCEGLSPDGIPACAGDEVDTSSRAAFDAFLIVTLSVVTGSAIQR
ncbi:unnamed protein product [Prorocentrum cordatum]|uniref:Uncharacterized protein n=1 Tax=Prorocentrum cordatum TaxID=2364126 RepID=A0ABN9RJY8_9DINO|nr:unnamed protein product [Polarella glacialis]